MPTKKFSAIQKCYDIVDELKDNDAKQIVVRGLTKNQADGIKLMVSIAYVAAHNADAQGSVDAQVRFDSDPFQHIQLGRQDGRQESVYTQWNEAESSLTLKFPQAAKPYQMQVFLRMFQKDIFTRAEKDNINFGNDKQEDVYICSYESKNELMADAMMLLGLMQVHGMNHRDELAIASEHNPPSLIIRKDAYEMLRKHEMGKRPDLPPR